MSFVQSLPGGLTAADAIAVLAGLAALLSVLTVYAALLSREGNARRAQALGQYRRKLQAAALAPHRRAGREGAVTIMRTVVERLRLMRSRQAEAVASKLARAGWRSKDAVVRFLFFKLALPFVLGGVVVLLLYGLDAYALAPLAKLAVSLLAVLAGSYAPDIFVHNQAQKRRTEIRKALPDGLDLMVICAEAGLSLDATVTRVAEEMREAEPEFADEFSLTAVELGLLPERDRALRNLDARCGLPAVRGMVSTLLQAERYGTPLAQSLRVLSAEFREERVLRAEEKAARLPALLTMPMIVFILPPLFVVLLGPAVLDVADSFRSLGW